MSVFLITGATSGIGAATARLAIKSGHQVFITGRDEERMRVLLAELGPQAGGFTGDAANWDDTQAAVAAALGHFGQIDVVFANAGFAAAGDFANGDIDEWRSMILTNVFGPMILARATLPALTKSQGQFILTSSVVGRRVVGGNAYSVTKWAATAFGESLRQQVVGTGIRVSVVEPGRVDTAFWKAGVSGAALSAEDIASTVMWITTISQSMWTSTKSWCGRSGSSYEVNKAGADLPSME